MALPDEPTADQLAAFLRSNDASSDVLLDFQSGWQEGMESWSDRELRAVSDAARNSNSIRALEIDVARLSIRAAGIIARIISNFRQVRRICVYDSQLHNPDAPMARPHVVDALLYGIMASRSKVEVLRIYGCCSPHLFREFTERFPCLEVLYVEGDCSRVAGATEEFDDFSVTIAGHMGTLPSLRRLVLDGKVGSAAFARLLSSVNKSSTVTSIILYLTNKEKGFLKDLFLFCTSDLTKTVNQVVVQEPTPSKDQFLDISTFFPTDAPEPFSPSIRDLQFYFCDATNVDDVWLNRAATALTTVEALVFGKCLFPRVFDLLERLSARLTEFDCMSRTSKVNFTDTLDDEFDDAPYMLGSNEELARFCQIIERKDSLLESVELDVVSVDDTVHFPAIASVLKHSKGRLVVNFGKLPHLSSLHVVKGATCLSHRLEELRIRFCRCQFGDNDFASFIRAFGSKKSLKVLEFGFDTHANLGTPTASISAIRHVIEQNDTLQELAIRGLGSGALTSLLVRIMPALRTTNRSLRALVLYGSDLADKWPRIREPVLEMLNSNGVLARLGGDFRLPENDPEAQKVQRLLDQNQYGRHFVLLRDPPAPRGLWPPVLARIAKDSNRKEVMYAFLRATVDLLLPSSVPPGRADPPPDGASLPSAGGRKRGRAEG